MARRVAATRCYAKRRHLRIWLIRTGAKSGSPIFARRVDGSKPAGDQCSSSRLTSLTPVRRIWSWCCRSPQPSGTYLCTKRSVRATEEPETTALSCARRFARFQRTDFSRDGVLCRKKSWLKLKIVCASFSIFELPAATVYQLIEAECSYRPDSLPSIRRCCRGASPCRAKLGHRCD